MQKLKDKRKERTTFEEVLSKNKVTTLDAFKKRPKDEGMEDDPDYKPDEIIDGDNGVEDEKNEEQEDIIDINKIRELEGDIEEDDIKDIVEENEDEQEKDNENEEEDEKPADEDDSNLDFAHSEAEEVPENDLTEEEIKKLEEIRTKKKGIALK